MKAARFVCEALTVVAAGVPLACSASSGRSTPAPELALGGAGEAMRTITEDDLERHVRILASDAYEGRAPATRGEDSTVAYLTAAFARAGLRPGNPDGSFIQRVPLVGTTVRASGSYVAGGRHVELRSPEHFVVRAISSRPDVAIENSEVLFAGYGVVAPGYGWDAYRGHDLRGKTVVLLFGDPPASNAADSAKVRELLDRWAAAGASSSQARRALALERGAAAVLFVHEEGPAGISYAGLVSTFTTENLRLASPTADTVSRSLVVFMHLDESRRLITAGGGDFERLKRDAANPGFVAVPLAVHSSFNVRSSVRDVVTRNVVARLDGSDPGRAREHVVYTAHWDHLGRDARLVGDQIYNGAVDNAGGTAQLLEIAEAFAKVRPRPKRSILFIATAAEEAGLLGAWYYIAHPLYPVEHTVAVINLDWFVPFGRTRDVIAIGHGNTTLDDVLAEAARTQGRAVTPDLWPEEGFFLRSDHYPFAKAGVPALFVGSGLDYVGRPAGWGKKMFDQYLSTDYHRVSDEVRPDWAYSGAAEDARLLFDVGNRVANTASRPHWRATTRYPEFKAAHEALLRRAGVRP